jgi:hypothetical protein
MFPHHCSQMHEVMGRMRARRNGFGRYHNVSCELDKRAMRLLS